MVFDSTTGMLSCQSCNLQLPIEEMQEEIPEKAQGIDLPRVDRTHMDAQTTSETTKESTAENTEENADEVFGDFEEFQEMTTKETFGEEEVTQYQCQNCGAFLLTDKDTTATNCSFCGAPVILGDRLTGTLAPTKVLPFSVSKAEAQDAFKTWCKKGRVCPRDFATAERINNITGMYVPFWLYDLNGRGEANANCTKVRTYTRGDYIYTETKFYDVYRKVDLNYQNIPADASIKMEDGLMDKLEPFHFNDLKPFKTPYLSGFISEKYNYTDIDLFPRVKARTEQYIDEYIRSTMQGYTSTTIVRKWSDVLQRDAHYTLLPVWMISYNYHNQNYIFAMNGQTGKIVGKPPISKARVLGWFAKIMLGSFILLRIITVLLGGPVL